MQFSSRKYTTKLFGYQFIETLLSTCVLIYFDPRAHENEAELEYFKLRA
jgi:hypothetical protein